MTSSVVIVRRDAKAVGLDRYFTGEPCKNGHVAERTVKKSDCVECLRARKNRWAAENQATASKKSRQWYEENRAKAAATRKAWRARNAEKYRADIVAYQSSHKSELRITSAKWRERNRGLVTSYGAIRRARVIRSTPPWADLEKIRTLYKEAARLTVETGIPHHVDHVIPLQSKWVCGLHVHTNLQILPAAENLSKSNRHWPGMPDEIRT
jgi:hypothetical protein